MGRMIDLDKLEEAISIQRASRRDSLTDYGAGWNMALKVIKSEAEALYRKEAAGESD